MNIFLKCQCSEPLVAFSNDKLLVKTNIKIINENCYIQCPICKKTSHFLKDKLINFYHSTSTKEQ